MLPEQHADCAEQESQQAAAGCSEQAAQACAVPSQQQLQQQQPPANQPVTGHGPAVEQLLLASGRAASCGEPMTELQLLEATLMSPNPFCPRSFITGDATIAPASKKQRSFCADAVHEGAAGEGQTTTPGGSSQAQGQQPVGGAALDAGTVGAMLAAEAARSAAMERYSSTTLLSPSGRFLLDPTRTQQLSLALAADGDPRVLPETPAAGTLSSSRVLMSPAAAHAGSKRPYSATRLDDRCTEICEAAQAVAMSSPTQGGSPSLAALMQWQQTIQAAEQQWGASHPAVGRAWLELARALQAADKDSDRAKHATKKAFDICMTSMKQTGTESHAQESFEYLLAKFNTKATAAKQAAAAASSEQGGLGAAAADALEALTPAAAAAAAATATLAGASPAPVQPASSSLPQAAAPNASTAAAAAALAAGPPAAGGRQACATAAPFGSVPSISISQAAVSAAEQLQMPYLGSPYMLGAYPSAMSHLALQALGGLPALQAGGSAGLSPVVMASAAQLMPTDLQAAALMGFGYPAALLPHTLLQAAGTPTAESLTMMQPSLLFAPPGRLPGAPAGLGTGGQVQLPAAGSDGAASSRQDRVKTSNKSAKKAAAGSKTAAAAATAGAAGTDEGTGDQRQAAQAKARKVLNL